MIRTTGDAYCLKRLWMEDCMPKSAISSKYIYEDYMGPMMLGNRASIILMVWAYW